jgi:hypothetical protein
LKYYFHEDFSSTDQSIGLRAKMKNISWGIKFLLSNGIPNKAFRFGGGLGDHLLCTTIFHEWAKRGVRKCWFLSQYHELFTKNPYGLRVIEDNWKAIKLLENINRSATLLYYGKWVGEPDRITPPQKHIIEEILQCGGITGKVSLRPYWSGDISYAPLGSSKRFVCVQSTQTFPSTPMGNKRWEESRLQVVVNQLVDGYEIIQLGTSNEPRLEQTTDGRNLSISESASMLANASFFVGQVGFLMHLARAVDTRSVIIYGGREKAWQSGYPCNANIESNLACSPCWQNNQCDHDRKCMSDITTNHVVNAIKRIEKRLQDDLETEEVEIPINSIS